MNRKIRNFFTDSHGKWAVIQMPNALLAAWILLAISGWLFPAVHLKMLQNCVLFAWAYVELTRGSSAFRKVLGAVILIVVTYNVVV